MHVFCGCLCLSYSRGDGVVGDVGVGFAVSVLYVLMLVLMLVMLVVMESVV